MNRPGVSKTFILVAVLCLAFLAINFVLPMTSFWGAAPSGPSMALQTVAKSFLEDLAAGRIQQATARTTPAFQQSHPPAELGKLVNKTPALPKLTDVRFESVGMLGKQAMLSGSTNGYQGSARVEIVLVQDETGNWLVDSVTFP